MMWFQRHEEPKTITEEFEQVVMVCHRLHSNNRVANCRLYAAVDFAAQYAIFHLLEMLILPKNSQKFAIL